MQKRAFLLLLAATAICVAAAIVTIVRGDSFVSAPGQDQPALPGLAAKLDDLAWIRIAHGAMTADFAMIDGRWAVVEKGNYPASPGRLHHLLIGLSDLVLIEPKTQRVDLYGRLGLDDPATGESTLVSLQDRFGKKLGELIVGKTAPDLLGNGENGVYVRKPGDAQTWLARGSLDVPGTFTDWLYRPIIDISPSRIESITMTDPDGAVLHLQRPSPAARFAVIDAPPDAKFRPPRIIEMPAQGLTELALDDVRPAADLAVPHKGVSTAAFTTFDHLTVTVRVFTRDAIDWAALSADGNGAAAQALEAHLKPWVFAIPTGRARLLRTRLSDLVEPAGGS